MYCSRDNDGGSINLTRLTKTVLLRRTVMAWANQK